MKMKSIIYSVAAASIAMMGFDAMACTNLLAGKTPQSTVVFSFLMRPTRTPFTVTCSISLPPTTSRAICVKSVSGTLASTWATFLKWLTPTLWWAISTSTK